MAAWYSIGLWLGLGVGIGVAFAGILGGVRALPLVAGAACAAAAGYALGGSELAVAGGVGATLGAAGALQLTSGALRRGGTRGGTAVLLAIAAAVLAALAFVPVLGYVEALVVPALAARLRRRLPERYAGLRSLARD